MNDELVAAKRDTEHQTELAGRANKEKEDLARERLDLQQQVAQLERGQQQLEDNLKILKSDKEALECMVAEVQQLNNTLSKQKDELDKELQETIFQKDKLQSAAQKLLFVFITLNNHIYVCS